MSEFFNEKTIMENALIKQLKDKGWKYIPGNNLHRNNYEEPLLISNLVRKIEEINEDCSIGDEEIKQILNELQFRSSGIEGIKAIIDFYKFGIPIKIQKDRIVNYIKLFDYENIKSNEFIVSNQVVFQSANKTIRADIVLYVNGIPLVIIECKNPVSFSSKQGDAYIQIKRYEKSIPELFKYIQIGISAEDEIGYFPIVPWQEEVELYQWKSEEKDSMGAITEMLAPKVLIDIIKNFIFFRVKLGEATKIITRYMQYRAANKIVHRVISNLEGKEEKNKGIIWHWQGSGKTLTMIFAGHKLFYLSKMENPSIYYIVDRKDLEEQFKGDLDALNIYFELISSVSELKDAVMHDDYKGKRGILLTLVHKFQPGQLEDFSKKLIKLSETESTIYNRKNVVSFIDEGHRTQYGALSAQMRVILKNSFFFAFTGTPISKKGRNTYEAFSYPPGEIYFDRYFITDSLKDGFTVKIVYKPRLEREVGLKKEDLDVFLESEFDELPEDIREKVETDIGRRLDASKVILENPEMIKRVAADIKEHFLENVDRKFKAMVAAESRKACVIFKRELDKLLPKEYSEIVMTMNKEEKHREIREYYKELIERFHGSDLDSIKKEIVENFKEEKFPKILIVTDMLLTGFDAPILQTMYLYKLLKEHRLLQAIARTNRPYKDLKEAGVIIDYVGILNQFKKAFAMYSKNEMEGALYKLEDLKEEFTGKLEKLMQIFKDVPKEQYNRETLLKAIEILTTKKNQGKEFLEDYRNLKKLFELLGPDELKIDYFKQFKWLTAVYIYYSKQVLKEPEQTKIDLNKYFAKTLKYVYQSTEIKETEKNFPVVAFDEDYLKILSEKVNSREEQAANIVFTLNKLVLVDKRKAPIYIAVADKVERILEHWKEKKKDYEQLYLEGTKIIKEINKLKSRQEKLNFSDFEYAILLILEQEIGKRENLSKDAKELSVTLGKEMYEGFVLQPTAMKGIERELRSFLRKRMTDYHISYEEMNKLHGSVKEVIQEYGEKSKNK
jgi:type I restriction enzyme R subunit